jgi:uncharacterized protein (TIGR03435 family)
MMKTTLVIIAIVSVVTGVLSQAIQPSIVSSVKRSQSVDEGSGGADFLQGDTFRMTNTPLISLLLAAFGTPRTRIIGGADWIRQDRWDVEIKVQPTDGQPRPGTRAVVQAMLRDRFKLDAAMEKRDHPVYALRRARADGKLGPNLLPASFECQRGNPQQLEALRASGVKGANGQVPCGTRSQRGVVSFAETGISGPVDLHLTWTFTDDPVTDQAALYAAVREQLGLKLDAATAPLDVLVIKSVTRPNPN